MRNFSPAHERRPQGLRTRLRTLTVRAFSGCSAKNSPSTGLSVAHPRKNSPSIGLPAALPRKNSPGTPKNSIFRPFWACRANYFAHTPIPGRAGRTFSRIARHAARPIETTNTFARHTARPIETTNTFARHTARPIETGNTFARHAAHPIETTDTFAGHTARPIETTDTFAHHTARSIETTNTFAGSKWPKNGLSSLAKAMAVSFRCEEVLAKVLSVS